LDNTRKESGFVLAYAGTIAWRYGLDIAVRAVALLADEMPDLRLVLVGDGDYIPDLKKLAFQLGVQDRVEFRGLVPLEQVPNVLAQCHASISPHLGGPYWDLNLSTKLCESLALGLPAISSRTKTVEAYLGDSLFYFEPEDLGGLVEQIRRLRARPELTQAKLSKAKGIISDLNWDKEKEKLQRIILELTQPPAYTQSAQAQEVSR
jgi:glycosyltransferase involved in cell wall biosynthesis